MQDFLSLLGAHPYWFAAYAGLMGLLIGSFLNVVILRLPPRMEWNWKREAREFLELSSNQSEEKPPLGLVVERSRCPKCGHHLAWWENLPLVSFLLLRGKCRGCKTPISWQYPLVEALTGALFALSAWQFGPSLYFLAALAFVSLLVAASGIDFRTTLLPDSLVFPLLWLGLLVAAFKVPGAADPTTAIFGGVAGYLSLWSVYWLFKLITGKEGMGYGDFKLLAALGVWCGPASLLSIVLVSTISGAIVGAILMAKRGDRQSVPFAFGPYLAIGGAMEFFFRGWLMGLLGTA